MIKSKAFRRIYFNPSEKRTLVLNNSYMPIDVITWKESVSHWFCDKAIILDSYDEIVKSGFDNNGNQFEMFIPSVILMKDVKVKSKHFVKILPLTKSNILARDGYRCCFSHCRKKLTLEEATIEHVYPKSRGGLNDWANLRSACWNCNNKKGDKTLEEMNWKVTPVSVPVLNKSAPRNILSKIGGVISHDSWKKYITWEIEDEHIK